MSKWKDIGTLLLEYGLINSGDLDEGLRLQKEKGLRLGEALAQLGKVSMDDIDWILSKQLDIPFVIVEDVTANTELLNKFKKDFLIENRMLPLYETDDQISIVIEDPFNKTALDFVKDSFGKKVNISTGSGKKIDELLKQTFKKVSIPELIASIKGIIERINETSFYRIDFLLDTLSCKISVFGFEVLKEIMSIEGTFINEDILKAFDSLNVPVLYEQSYADRRTFLSIYPLVHEIDSMRLPAIVGTYGLCLPAHVTFADTANYDVPLLFYSGHPVQGYNYISTKRNEPSYEKSIYTIDAAPGEFKDYYLKLYIPRRCPSCRGTGCQDCNDLGYEFNKMEGVYSSCDLKEKWEEVRNGED